MTISNTARTAGPYAGTGANTSFPFAFKVFARSDLLVARTVTATGVETILVLDVDYAVSLNGNQNTSPGGSIILTSSLAVGTTLAATSNIPIQQSLELTNQGGFYPTVINDALDRIVIQIQQLASKVGGVNIGSAATIATLLAFVGKINSGNGASEVGYTVQWASLIRSNVAQVLGETVNLYRGFTAAQIADSMTGNPTFNGVQVLQAAIDYYSSKGGACINISGPILFKGSGGTDAGRTIDGITLKSNVKLRCVGAGKIIIDKSCVVAIATRPLVALTSLDQAPHDMALIDMHIVTPEPVWDISTQNCALLHIAAANRMRVTGLILEGFIADGILVGANGDSGNTVSLPTFVRDLEISSFYIDGKTKKNRQGISILAGVDVWIKDGIVTRTTRSAADGDPMPGGIDIEPNLASAQIANIRLRDIVLDDIGGVTGALSIALGLSHDQAPHDISAERITFRNISNVSDVFCLGLASPDHVSLPANAPYSIRFSSCTHDPLSNLTPNRRFWIGGVRDLSIIDPEVYGGNTSAILGYDDGTNHFPIDGLTMSGWRMRNWVVEGSIFEAPLTFFGGILNSDITDMRALDCGNQASGVAKNMTLMAFVGNAVKSKNVRIDGIHPINSGAFSVDSFPVYAAPLDNPLTFTMTNLKPQGLGAAAFNSQYSIYAQVPGDYYDGFIPIPSTATPLVGGGKNFTASTGDTFTNFVNGKVGQRILIAATGSGYTIANNANIKTTSGANLVVVAGKNAEVTNIGGSWQQV